MKRRSVLALAASAAFGGCTALSPPQGCPDLDGSDSTVCYNSGSNTGVTLVPDTTTVTLPNAAVELTLRNQSDATFNTNLGTLTAYKRTTDGWQLLFDGTEFLGENMLAPGETHTWHVGFGANSYPGEPTISLAETSPGEYAFRIDGWTEARSEEKSYVAVVTAER